MPQKFEFLITPRSSIWAKNRIDGYGAKSRWGPLGVHLGADGVPLGQKYGSNPLKITMQQNSNFWPFQGHQFGQKIEFTVMAPNHGGDPLGYIGWPMGPIGAKKWMKTVKNYHAPKLLLWGHRFGQNNEFTVMAPNHGGEPLGSILVPVWSHWGRKIGQNRKILPCPKIRPFATPRSSIWAKNRIYGYGAKSRWGTPRVHLGADGVPLEQKKWVKTVKNYRAPKFEFLTTPWSSIWAKTRIYGYGAKSRLGPPRVHFRANGFLLEPKMGQDRKKLPCPKNSNFWLLRGHRFGQKIELTVMAPNHGGDPLGYILGPMGSHWGRKMGQNR